MANISDVLTYAGCVAASYSAGAVGRFLSPSEYGGWYDRLKPSWTPPPKVFPIAWGILYACIGSALFLALRYGLGRATLVLFAANLALNAAWSPLFFGRQAFTAAFAAIVGMVITCAGIIAAFAVWSRGSVRVAGIALLLPYLGWLCFAGALNLAIIMASRKKQ